MTPESVFNSIGTDAAPEVQSWKQRWERVLQSPCTPEVQGARPDGRVGKGGAQIGDRGDGAPARRVHHRKRSGVLHAKGLDDGGATAVAVRHIEPRLAGGLCRNDRQQSAVNSQSPLGTSTDATPVLSGPQLANAVAAECCRLTAEQLMWSTSLDYKTSAVNNAQLQDCAAPGRGWAAGRSRCTAAVRCPQTPPAGSAHQQRAL